MIGDDVQSFNPSADGKPESSSDRHEDPEKIRSYLTGLLGMPRLPDACPRGPTRLYRHKISPKLCRVAGLQCRSWRCESCAYRMKRFLGIHYGRCFLAFGQPLHVGRIATADWDSKVRRRISRARQTGRPVSYLRVDPAGDGCEVLFCTIPMPELRALGLESVVGRLGNDLLAICPPADESRCRPCDSSQNWTPKPGRLSDWKREATMRPHSLYSAGSALRDAGVSVTWRSRADNGEPGRASHDLVFETDDNSDTLSIISPFMVSGN